MHKVHCYQLHGVSSLHALQGFMIMECRRLTSVGSTCLAELFPISSMSMSMIVLPELADSLLNSEVATGVFTTELPNSVCAIIFVGFVFHGFSIFTDFRIRVTRHP